MSDAWLHESVGTCPWCDEPVRRINPRALDGHDRLGHLACVTVVEGECAVCGEPVSRRQVFVERDDEVTHDECMKPKGR